MSQPAPPKMPQAVADKIRDLQFEIDRAVWQGEIDVGWKKLHHIPYSHEQINGYTTLTISLHTNPYPLKAAVGVQEVTDADITDAVHAEAV